MKKIKGVIDMDRPIKIIVLILLMIIVMMSFSFLFRFRKLRNSYMENPSNTTAALIRKYLIYMSVVLLALIVISVYVFVKLKPDQII